MFCPLVMSIYTLMMCSDYISMCNTLLFKINNWADENRLCLNSKKSKCIVIYKKHFDTTQLQNLMIGNSPIKYEESAGNMGIAFNNTLAWSNHISKAAGRTYGLLRQLSTSQSFLPTQLCMLVAKTIVYGVEIFGHCDTQDTQKWTVACNSTVRYVFILRRTDHTSHLVNSILDLSLCQWIGLKTLIYLQKTVCTFSSISKNPNLYYP